jgi:uncharacterized protein (TIGR00369 family)
LICGDRAGANVVFQPQDPDFEGRVRSSFARQPFMGTLGARLFSVAPGEVVLELPFDKRLTQQTGYLHAGVVAAIADNACGYAALSLMPPATEVLSVEFKINLMAPGAGAVFRAAGRVIRAGRTLTVCSAEVVATDGDRGKVVAVMQATMMSVPGRPGLTD